MDINRFFLFAFKKTPSLSTTSMKTILWFFPWSPRLCDFSFPAINQTRPCLSQDTPACEERGTAQQLPVKAAPLEWYVPEKCLTTDLLLAAARQKACFMTVRHSSAAHASLPSHHAVALTFPPLRFSHLSALSLQPVAFKNNALCDPFSLYLLIHSFLILLSLFRFPPVHRPCVFIDPSLVPSNRTGFHPDGESSDLPLFCFPPPKTFCVWTI